MAVLRSALVMTTSLSAPVGLVVVAPMVLEGPLKTDGPVSEVIQQHERRTLSQLGLAGRTLFRQNCVECHGEGAIGSDKATSLLHSTFHRESFDKRAFHRSLRISEPVQTASVSIVHAFPDLSFNEIERMERYVRELQKPFDFR